jgi:hypothetical protein
MSRGFFKLTAGVFKASAKVSRRFGRPMLIVVLVKVLETLVNLAVVAAGRAVALRRRILFGNRLAGMRALFAGSVLGLITLYPVEPDRLIP